MKILDVPQLSPEWWEARCGVATASQFHRIITPKKGDLSASAMEYINELVADRIAQHPKCMTEKPMTPAMRYGSETEPEARDWYAFDREVDVRQVGFCLSDCGRFGASPDGLIGDDGGLELKCPEAKTHVGYLLGQKLPDEYKAQVHGSLIVTGRAWWDFVSYARGFPPLVVRVTPDEFTTKLRDVLEQFWAFYRAAWERLGSLRTPTPTEVTHGVQ